MDVFVWQPRGRKKEKQNGCYYLFWQQPRLKKREKNVCINPPLGTYMRQDPDASRGVAILSTTGCDIHNDPSIIIRVIQEGYPLPPVTKDYKLVSLLRYL